MTDEHYEWWAEGYAVGYHHGTWHQSNTYPPSATRTDNALTFTPEDTDD